MEFILKSETQIQTHLPEIMDFADGRKVWLFVGEMGAGKTTSIKNICQAIEVEDAVSSPTFSIVNEYFSAQHGTVYHFDCFRIKSDDEAQGLGLEDYFYSGYHCLVEWPDKVEAFIPDEFLLLQFEKIDEQTRKLTIAKDVE